MRLIYIALALAATSALVFMLLWGQSESEKAQLLDKYEVMRTIAGQEQAAAVNKPNSEQPTELHSPTEFVENSPVQPELTVNPAPAPSSKPVQSQSTAASVPALSKPQAKSGNSEAENLQKIQGIQQRLLAQMTAGKAINIDEVAKLLGELQDIEKSGVNFQGMDFSIALKNLQLAKKMQEVSDEIQQISKATPPDSNKLTAALEQMNKLQAQIKSPVSIPPAPAN